MFDLLDITQKLINIPSITPNDAHCQKLIAQWLTELGFTIKHLPSHPVDNLWATYGTQNPTLVLAGHTDVVTPGEVEAWHSPPFKTNIDSHQITGRGIVDMKGSLACMIIATQQLLKQNPKLKGTIAFLITSGEEGEYFQQGTPVVLDYLKKNHIAIDYCIIGEPTSKTSIGDTIKIGRRGSLHGTLRAQGKQGHIAYPHLAQNPIHEISSAVAALSQIKWQDSNEFFQDTELQISHIKAGDGSRNIIPGECVCFFNIRFGNTKPERIQQTINDIISEHCKHFKLDWKLSGPSFLSEHGKLVKVALESIQEVQEISTALSTNGGTSDGRFISQYCNEIIELGLCHKTAHHINESCMVEDLKQLTEIYLSMFKKLLL